MRIFFAIAPSQDTLARVDRVFSVLRRRSQSDEIRWARVEQLHFTLKFLGEQANERVSSAIEAARKVALASSPFDLEIAALGAFPSPERPRVLWMGASEPSAGACVDLANRLDRELERAGFERERRPFHPHLTLARSKSREAEREVSRLLEKAGEIGEVARERVEGFVLMKSELSPKGSSYSVVESFAFPRPS